MGIEAAIIANMHEAIDKRNFQQVERAKKVLEGIKSDSDFVDYQGNAITLSSQLLNLSTQEILLRFLLLSSLPEVTTYNEISQLLWSREIVPAHNIHVVAQRLKTRLAKFDPPEQIINFRSFGYTISI